MRENLLNTEALKTVDIILLSAKKEFLEKGFRGASLRNIAKQAGVTTGAIYGYFKDKDEIFVQLVQEVIEGFYRLLERIEREDRQRFYSGECPDSSIHYERNSHRKYIDYMYEHLDESKLIITCSHGSSVENYIHNIMDRITLENRDFFNKMKEGSGIDDFTVHVILEFYLKATTEFIKHDVPYEIAIKQFDKITAFYFAGWNVLMK